MIQKLSVSDLKNNPLFFIVWYGSFSDIHVTPSTLIKDDYNNKCGAYKYILESETGRAEGGKNVTILHRDV